MKTAVLNIKIDPKVKRDAQKVADDLGFSLSAIINASLKNLARSKTISYSVLEPSPLLKKAITASRAERKKVTPVRFSSSSEMMKSLRA